MESQLRTEIEEERRNIINVIKVFLAAGQMIPYLLANPLEEVQGSMKIIIVEYPQEYNRLMTGVKTKDPDRAEIIRVRGKPLPYPQAVQMINEGKIKTWLIDPLNQSGVLPGHTRVTLIGNDREVYQVHAIFENNQIFPPQQ